MAAITSASSAHAGAQVIISDELLSCGVCLERYSTGSSAVPNRTPRLLACGHTLCYSCAANIHTSSGRNRSVSCPFDRQVQQVTDINQLAVNFALQSLISQPAAPAVVAAAQQPRAPRAHADSNSSTRDELRIIAAQREREREFERERERQHERERERERQHEREREREHQRELERVRERERERNNRSPQRPTYRPNLGGPKPPTIQPNFGMFPVFRYH